MASIAPRVRVVLEYLEDAQTPVMHWERTVPRMISGSAGPAVPNSPNTTDPHSTSRNPTDPSASAAATWTFDLLGRAFEVAQREESAAFADALRAFFKGALISKGDVAGVLAQME